MRREAAEKRPHSGTSAQSAAKPSPRIDTFLGSAGARNLVGAGAVFLLAIVALISSRAMSTGVDWNLVLDTMPGPDGEVTVLSAPAHGVGWSRGIRSGDAVLFVDDVPAPLLTGQIVRDARQVAFRDRQGNDHTVQAPDRSMGILIPLIIVSLGLVSLGWTVFRWTVELPVGVSFLAFGASLAIAIVASPASATGDLVASILAMLAGSIAPAAFLAVALLFPRPHRFAGPLIVVAGGLAVLLGGLGTSLLAGGLPLPEALNTVLFLLFGADLVGAIALLVARSLRPTERSSLAPVAVGALVGIAPVVTFTAIPRLAGAEPLLPGEITGLGAIAIPIAFAYAIVRHRLFALDAIVRRILIRTLTVFGALLAFGCVWIALRALTLDITDAVLLAAVVASLVEHPIRHWTRGAVDTWLYPGAQKVADEAGALDAAEPRAIGRTAGSLIRQAVPTVWAACIAYPHVEERTLGALAFVGGDGDVPAGVEDGSSVEETLRAGSRRQGLVAAPINRSGAKLGYLLVGPRIDGTPLSGADVEVVHTVARSIAAPLEAALLRERAEEETHFREDLLRLARDLAAAHSAEDVLATAGRHASQLLHASHVDAWRGHPDGRYSLVGNPEAVRATSTLDVVVGADQALALRRRGVARSSGETASLACALGRNGVVAAVLVASRTKPGAVFTVEDERRALEIASHVAGALRRATEREQALETLERLQRHQELLLTSAGEGIVGFDAEGHVTFVNPAAVRYTGFEASELVGCQVHTLLHHSQPDGAPQAAETFPIYRTLEEGTPRSGSDETFWRKDGRSFPVEYQATPIYEDGQVVGAVLTFKDITHRRANERMKDEFVSMVSHELRTPLNGVIGLTDLLSTTQLTPLQRDYSGGIKRAGETLLSIINDILDFSKIEAGQLKLDDADLDVRAVADDVVQLLREQAAAKGIELASIVHRTIPEHLRGDSGHLRQILLNLVGNAVKFTESGEVIVRAKLHEEQAERLTLRFEVQDTGIGIPPEARNRLFRPFSQVDASMTRKYGGTGLGLAICKRTVEMMGGQIDVESEPGRGSTFWFTVVLSRSRRSSPARPLATAISSDVWLEPVRTAHVLLVEDSLVSQQVAVGMLKTLGHTVDVAENGRAAVDAFKTGHYDAVLMDCRMPEMDGFQATTLIRQHEAGQRRTPIIAMTAHARSGDRDRCLAVGMDDYLAKPVHLKDLEQALARWLPDDLPTPQEAVDGRAADEPVPLRAPMLPSAAEVLALSLEEAAASLDRLRGALAAGDVEGIRAAAHRIARDSAVAGQDQLCALVRRIEAFEDVELCTRAVSVADQIEAALARLRLDRAA